MDVERVEKLLRQAAEDVKTEATKLSPVETWRGELAKAAIEVTPTSNEAAALFQKWLQQLRTGKEITLEGDFIPHGPRTNEPIKNKPVEKFAFRKGISNVK